MLCNKNETLLTIILYLEPRILCHLSSSCFMRSADKNSPYIVLFCSTTYKEDVKWNTILICNHKPCQDLHHMLHQNLKYHRILSPTQQKN